MDFFQIIKDKISLNKFKKELLKSSFLPYNKYRFLVVY